MFLHFFYGLTFRVGLLSELYNGDVDSVEGFIGVLAQSRRGGPSLVWSQVVYEVMNSVLDHVTTSDR
jgi:hypothetical protein